MSLVVLWIKWTGINGNKIQKLYRCGSNYALSKITQVNDLEDLWRKVNPDSSEFNRYNRSLRRRSRIGRVYTVKKKLLLIPRLFT